MPSRQSPKLSRAAKRRAARRNKKVKERTKEEKNAKVQQRHKPSLDRKVQRLPPSEEKKKILIQQQEPQKKMTYARRGRGRGHGRGRGQDHKYNQRQCRKFDKNGFCPFGKGCRFIHVLSPEHKEKREKLIAFLCFAKQMEEDTKLSLPEAFSKIAHRIIDDLKDSKTEKAPALVASAKGFLSMNGSYPDHLQDIFHVMNSLEKKKERRLLISFPSSYSQKYLAFVVCYDIAGAYLGHWAAQSCPCGAEKMSNHKATGAITRKVSKKTMRTATTGSEFSELLQSFKEKRVEELKRIVEEKKKVIVVPEHIATRVWNENYYLHNENISLRNENTMHRTVVNGFIHMQDLKKQSMPDGHVREQTPTGMQLANAFLQNFQPQLPYLHHPYPQRPHLQHSLPP